MKKSYLSFIAICCMALLAGCNKDETSVFSGYDNYISHFRLTLEENGYTAAITGDSIIIRTVEGRDLSGAEVGYVLSENATIYPDPAGIEDWDSEQTFVVTSYNGRQHIYHYAVHREKAEEVKKGNFMLTTQTEVNDFGSLGVRILDGNLSIGSEGNYEETDPITTLSPLASLQKVKGNLTLNGTGASAPDNLEGLGNLQETGSLTFAGFGSDRWTLLLPELETVHGDLILAVTPTAIILSKLTVVEGNLMVSSLSNDCVTLEVPNLTTVVGDLNLSANGGAEGIKRLAFPKLETIGGTFEAYAYDKVTDIALPQVKRCGAINWHHFGSLTDIVFPSLEEVAGEVIIRDMVQPVETVSMPKVSYIGSLSFNAFLSISPAKIDLPNLTRAQSIYLTNNANLEDLDFLNKLTSVDVLSLTNLTGLQKTFKIPASLTHLDELTVGNLPGLTSLDVRGTGIKSIGVTSSSQEVFTLTADDILEGSLTLSGSFQLNGFKEIRGNLSFSCPASDEMIDPLPNTEIVGGNFNLSYTGTKGGVSVSALQSIGGEFKISSAAPVKADKLKTVGSTLTYDLGTGSQYGSSLTEFALPSLQSVGKDFQVYTQSYNSSDPTFEIKMPQLTTIGGELLITRTYLSSARPGYALKDLDGFSSLTRVKTINITKQYGLKSYRGLEKAIRSDSFTEQDYIVNNNGYNPKYSDLIQNDAFEAPEEE